MTDEILVVMGPGRGQAIKTDPEAQNIEVNVGEDGDGRPIWLKGVLIGPETIPGLDSFRRVVVTDQREAMVQMSVHRGAIRPL